MVVPPLIKRNTALLALSQAFSGAGIQLAYALGPLIVVSLMGSAALAGITVTLLGVSKFLVAYPIGKVTDTYGRKPGMVIGLSLALVGSILVGMAINRGSFGAFAVGLLIFSMGINAAHQMRVAAADMFPASLRAQAVGWVLTGSLVGTFVAPVLVAVAESSAHLFGSTEMGLPWLIMPLLIVPGIAFVLAVRPDPRDIAADLHRYYPWVLARNESGADGAAHGLTIGRLLDHPARRGAILANAACHGNMSIAMVTTSLVLAHHGSALAEISVAGAFHSAGMFAFSLPLGWVADRLGRRAVLLGGAAVATLGAVFVAWGGDYAVVAFGTFLVGLGWAASNVSTTALIADTTAAFARGRAIGLSDSIASGTSIAVAMVTGLLLTSSGVGATGVVALLLMVPALALAAHLPTAQVERVAADVPLLRAG